MEAADSQRLHSPRRDYLRQASIWLRGQMLNATRLYGKVLLESALVSDNLETDLAAVWAMIS